MTKTTPPKKLALPVEILRPLQHLRMLRTDELAHVAGASAAYCNRGER